MRLATRLFLVVLACLLPLALAEAWNAYMLHQSRRAEVEQEAVRQAQITAADIQRLVEGVWGISKVMSKAPVLQKSMEECSRFMASVLPDVPYVVSMASTDLAGNIRCASGYPNQSPSIAERSYFKEAVAKGGPVIGEYIIGKVSKLPLLPLATVTRDEAGQINGVIVATLNLQWLSDYLKTRGLPEGGSVTVADRNGTIVARQPLPEKFVGTVIPDRFLYLLKEPKPGAIDVLSQDGTPRILGYVPLDKETPGLYVSTGLSREASFALLTDSNWRQLGFWLVTVAISLGAAIAVSSVFIRHPLSRILAALNSVQLNDLSARTGMKDRDGELAYIGAELDRTVEKLETRSKSVSLLMRELQHRSKNQITMILSMARLIGKKAKSVADYDNGLRERLTSLASSYDMLLATDGAPVDMHTLLATQLRIFGLEDSAQITASAAPLSLTPKAAGKIGLVFHELLTNAQKYGALSSGGGQVRITWRPLDTGKDLYRLTWSEQLPFTIGTPAHEGFGSLLLKAIIPADLDGEARMHFGANGVTWEMDFCMPAADPESTAPG